jgi:hypothetical protein
MELRESEKGKSDGASTILQYITFEKVENITI